jgi:hypothetical protein
MLESIKRINQGRSKRILAEATMHAEQWFLHFAPEGEELLDFIL